MEKVDIFQLLSFGHLPHPPSVLKIHGKATWDSAVLRVQLSTLLATYSLTRLRRVGYFAGQENKTSNIRKLEN